MATDVTQSEDIGEINKYDFRTETKAVFKARKGLDREIVGQISEMKERVARLQRAPRCSGVTAAALAP